MNVTVPHKKSKAYIQNSTLILLAFATAFFPRVIESAGAPAIINFLHFVTIPFTCGSALLKSRTKNRKQIAIVWSIISGLFLLLTVMFASALLNNAGVINVILDFLLLGEPVILLLATIVIPMMPKNLEKFRTWLIRCGFINLFLAFGQYILFVILRRHPKPGNPDYIQGVFYHSGAGHVVSASVSLTFSLYYLASAKTVPLWVRLAVAFAAFVHMLISDAKQVIAVFLVAGMLLLLTKLKDVGEAIKYLSGAIALAFIFIWCTQNIPALDGFNTWARPEIYGSEGEATLLKTASLRIIPSYFESPLNWLLGLGPGHTVGRLGGWMLDIYWNLLEPLGATQHPASSAVWAAVGASWLGDQSSMFSPLFGWAGIWGDLGFLGLGAYLFLAWLVWRYLCLDDLSRFLLLTIFVFGLIFSQMEEPGYMLFMATILALRWHEHQKIPLNLDRD